MAHDPLVSIHPCRHRGWIIHADRRQPIAVEPARRDRTEGIEALVVYQQGRPAGVNHGAHFAEDGIRGLGEARGAAEDLADGVEQLDFAAAGVELLARGIQRAQRRRSVMQTEFPAELKAMSSARWRMRKRPRPLGWSTRSGSRTPVGLKPAPWSVTVSATSSVSS